MTLRALAFILLTAWALAAVPALAQQSQRQPKGYLGIELRDISKEEADKLGWKSPRGIKVRPLQDGPAASAGILADDVIIALDDQEVENARAFAAKMDTLTAGAQVRLKLLRSGKETTVNVALGRPPPPPQEPILRIDPGMHTAPVRRIGVDAACTLMATASSDKSLRLWRLPGGKLLRTLRPPIGPGNDGQLNAVAVAPDGGWVAAGGWSSDEGHYVYVFRVTTGAMLARLGPFSNVVLNLAVSSDGRHLAATLHGGEGLRVWERTGADAADWRLVAEDRDYAGKPAEGAAFDRAGTLFTTAYDGKLRRYAPGYKGKPSWIATRGGTEPFALAVHPSGKSVAVGHVHTIAVDIYDAATLAWRFSTDTTGVNNGSLSDVAWSTDGSRLYAGGLFAKRGLHPILVWGRRGFEGRPGGGRARELEGSRNGIAGLFPCGDAIAFGAFDPGFGLVAPDGRRLWQEGVQVDLRRAGLFAVADGRRIGFEAGNKRSVTFDLVGERLDEVQDRPADLAGSDTTSLPISDWNDQPIPKLAGAPIKLEQNEWANSLAIAPGKQGFVLGTHWLLRGYDKDGKGLWLQQAPASVQALNISRDGKLVLAAYGDGTVRWHRLSDGQELFALFVHKGDRRWVAWTPTGYYMASPGAESLIGWHVNRSWDEAAQFFPVDRFRDQFNRPDIVKLVLETLDESKAIDAANTRANVKRATEDVRSIAPPIVVVQKPGDGSTFRTPEVTLEYDILSPTGQKVSNVDFLINNAALGARFAAPIGTGKYTSGRVTLPLPAEDVTITLVARDEGNRASEPVSVRLRWDGAKSGQVALPRLRALFVGVNAYTSPKLAKLDFAAKDAADMATFFKSQEGRSYNKVEANLLRDAKRIDMLNGLEWLEKGSEEGDVNLLFLAGHGATIDQHFYYMASDSDPDMARATAVSRDEILRTIRNRKGAMVVMLDACHSGASTDAPPAGASRVDMNRLANELGDQSLGVLLYASARGRQFSYERAEWGNGAFTRAVLDGLAGGADSGQLGYVETDELAVYVRRRVMAMTKGLQEPVRVKPDAAPEMKIARHK